MKILSKKEELGTRDRGGCGREYRDRKAKEGQNGKRKTEKMWGQLEQSAS